MSVIKPQLVGLRDLSSLLRLMPRRRLLLLMALMLACGLTEGLGLLLLVPWLQWMQSGVVPAGLSAWLPLHSMPIMLSGLLLLVVLRGRIQFARNLHAVELQHAVVDALRENVFSSLLSAEWQWLSARRQSEHASLLITDIQRIGMGVHYLLGLLTSLVMLVCYGVVALMLSWPITLLALLSGGITLRMLVRQRSQATALGHQLGEASRQLHATIHDNLSSLKLGKLLGSAAAQQQALSASMRALRSRQMAFHCSNGRAQWFLQVIATALLCVYISIGLTWLTLPIADLLVLVLVFARMTPMLSALQQQLYGCLHVLPVLTTTLQVLRDSAASAEPDATATIPAVMALGLQLDNVSLHFPGRDNAALSDVRLTLPVRSTTALVGASGSGKSTLADLVSGLLVPDQGCVLLDGVPLSGSLRMAWRKAVAYVPQEVSLRHDSIRNNLLWGLTEISEDALWSALQRAAADFVHGLPLGLDTVIGDHGIRLSGGERQRLGLARALLRQPALLILDESTSALDHAHEQRIRDAVRDLRGDLTLLIIGHRLTMLEHADQVAVLSQGRLIGVGPWADVGHLAGIPSPCLLPVSTLSTPAFLASDDLQKGIPEVNIT